MRDVLSKASAATEQDVMSATIDAEPNPTGQSLAKG